MIYGIYYDRWFHNYHNYHKIIIIKKMTVSCVCCQATPPLARYVCRSSVCRNFSSDGIVMLHPQESWEKKIWVYTRKVDIHQQVW